jgi:predicted Zn-dependent peptidase
MKLLKLSNGIRLLYRYTHSELSRIFVSFSRGAVNDTLERIPGATHMMEHMLFKAPSKEETEFNSLIETLGCDSNAFTYYDGLVITVSGLNLKFAEAFRHVMNFSLNPRFGEDEFDLEKEVVVQEIRNYLADNNYFYFTKVLPKFMLKSTPYDTPIYGDEPTVRSLEVSTLRDIYEKWFFDPNDIIVSYAGSRQEEEIIALCEEVLLNRGARVLPSNTEKNVRATPIDGHHNKEMAGQAFLTMYYHLDKTDLDTLTLLELLSTYLTGGSASVLFRELRQNRGLVYGVSSEAQIFGKNLFFGITTEFSKTNMNEIVDLMRNRLLIQALDELDSEGLDRAKTKYLLSLAREFEAYGSYCIRSIEYLRLLGQPQFTKAVMDSLGRVGNLDSLRGFYKSLLERQAFISSMA